MALLPIETVRILVAAQVRGARIWAERRNYELHFDEAKLTMTVSMLGGDAEGKRTERYTLCGGFDDFNALPPDWRFADPRTGDEIGLAANPAPPPSNIRLSGGSIFHPNGVICAPWSRRAYQSLGGPHGDWGPLTSWRTERPGMTRAETIPAMLATIDVELGQSRGRMAALP